MIDIDDEDYKRIQDISDVFNSLTSRTYSAIRNGTPLPKGHGRLIDADALYNDLEFPTKQFAEAFKEILNDTPTIIEADKENDR